MTLKLDATVLIRRPILSWASIFPSGASDSDGGEAISKLFESPFIQSILDTISSRDSRNRVGKSQRDAITKYRYLSRLASRSVPLGWSAITHTGRFTDTEFHTAAPLGDVQSDQIQFHLSLDSGIVGDVFRLARLRLPSNEAAVTLNPSAYRAGAHVRFYEPTGGMHSADYKLSQIEVSDELDLLLDLVRSNEKFGPLVQCMASQAGLSEADAAEYVSQLASAGLLYVGPLAPLADIDRDLAIERICSAAGPALPELENLRSTIVAIQQSSRLCIPGQPPDLYELTRSAARVLVDAFGPQDETRSSSAVFECHATASLNSSLPLQVARRIERCIDDLLPYFNATNLSISEYAKLLEKKFGEQPVSILLAVDPELGVDLHSNLSPRVQRQLPEQVLLALWEKSLASGDVSVELSLDSIQADKGFVESKALESETGMVQFEMVSEPSPNGPFLFLQGFRSGPKSRFSSRFRKFHRALNQDPAGAPGSNDEAVHVDVLHAGSEGLANLTSSPADSMHVIVCDDIAVPEGKINIPLSDVYLRALDGSIMLFSRGLDRQIIPRFNNAVGPHVTTRPAIALLGYIDRYNIREYDFKWPVLLQGASFLPRVVYNGVALSLARWKLDQAQLDEIISTTEPQGIRSMLAGMRVPRYFRSGVYDKILTYDSTRDESLMAFRHSALSQKPCLIFESLANLSERGEHAEHQIQASFQRVIPKPRSRPPMDATTPVGFGFVFRPGEEWATIKIYGNEDQLGRLVTSAVRPLIEEMRAESKIERWHFLRYRDPHPHIRLRVCGAFDDIWRHAVPLALAKISGQPLRSEIIDVAIEPYRPEVGRYGGPEGIELHERIFQADSEVTLDGMEIAARLGSPVSTQYLSLARMDCLLSGAGLDWGSRRDLLRSVARGSTSRSIVTAKFQSWRTDCKTVLADPHAKQMIDAWRQHAEGVYASAFGEPSALPKHLINIPSLLHMSINRGSGMLARSHEAALLEVLARDYDGRIARRHNNP